MNSLLRLSEATSLAFHSMTILARETDGRISAGELAKSLNSSLHTLAKVMQRLAHAGLVESERGPKGGFVLGRPAHDMTLLDIYEAVEGPIGGSECLLGTSVCRAEGCVMGGLTHSIYKQVIAYFTATSVADLATRVTIGTSEHG